MPQFPAQYRFDLTHALRDRIRRIPNQAEFVRQAIRRELNELDDALDVLTARIAPETLHYWIERLNPPESSVLTRLYAALPADLARAVLTVARHRWSGTLPVDALPPKNPS